MNSRAIEHRRFLIDTLAAAGLSRSLLQDDSVSVFDLDRLRDRLPEKVRTRAEYAARNKLRYGAAGHVISLH